MQVDQSRVKGTWFKPLRLSSENLVSKFHQTRKAKRNNSCRYFEAKGLDMSTVDNIGVLKVGLYTLNAVDPQLESNRFQPLNLSSGFLVSSLCFPNANTGAATSRGWRRRRRLAKANRR
jgi:hypothetical protein